MGTNYYRIPKASEIDERKKKLLSRINEMELNLSNANNNFSFIDDPDCSWNRMNPWDEFTKGISIHLGKRSGGWKFCWNFHNKKYFSNKEELFEFIRSGRVVNEYGDEITPNEFIDMALNWDVDGWDNQKYYKENPVSGFNYLNYTDDYIDGLRVSKSTEFS